MQLVSLFSVCALCLAFCLPTHAVTSEPCFIPPFDKRRCYQLYWDRPQSWSSSSTACQATGQRLASIENGKLLTFINDYIGYTRVWIGLQRAADGQPDKWTNGGNFVPALYPGILLNVSRAGLDTGKLCSVADKDVKSALANTFCTELNDRICETVKTTVYKVKSSGQLVKDVGPGQLRAARTVLECARTCHRELTCMAISHDGVTCQVHFQQAGHNLTVTSIPRMYFLPE